MTILARARACALALALATLCEAQASWTGTAQAQQPRTATADDRRRAAKDFAEGDRSFAQGDYQHAAEAYDRAYKRVPHHDVLWNEARAWHRARELTRAANTYARYLREAPAGARDRNSAQKALGELSTKLALLEIHAEGLTAVVVDGETIDGQSVYVTPGEHIVQGRTGDGKAVRQTPDVHAGEDVSVVLVAPPEAPAPAPVLAPPIPSGRTWSPLVVIGGGAATAVLAGLTIGSGLDTLSAKNAFEQNPTRADLLDSGRQKETRTNVLLAATAGVGLRRASIRSPQKALTTAATSRAAAGGSAVSSSSRNSAAVRGAADRRGPGQRPLVARRRALRWSARADRRPCPLGPAERGPTGHDRTPASRRAAPASDPGDPGAAQEPLRAVRPAAHIIDGQ
jgi:hypothetical protein